MITNPQQVMLPSDEIDELFEDAEENVLPPDNIVVLNELRSAADLNRLMADDESIDLKPDFQREEVWTDAAKAKFVDSLSKEFPIPSMCFALDPKKQKYIVIDGRQRMSTVKKFLGDDEWLLPNLKDVDSRISGKRVFEIRDKYPEIYRKIENISLPVTILRYDPSRPDNMEYIFTIFQRLNSLGESLNNQEIRNAIYQGPFNTFLKECARNSDWEDFTSGQTKTRSVRMIGEERLLRFFAFYDDQEGYTGKLNSFLNSYMQKNRFMDENNDKKEILRAVMAVVKKVDSAKINKSNALRDAFLYGVSKNLLYLKEKNASDINLLLIKLEENPNFSVTELSGGIMMKKKVINRLQAAKTVFSAVG